MQMDRNSLAHVAAIAAMTDYVAAPDFPCVGARSAFNKGRVSFGHYASLGDAAAAAALCDDLTDFSRNYPDPGNDAVSFVATFGDEALDEACFAQRMWAHLQAMHDHDRLAFAWDPTVSADPAAPDFSFSIGGRAFFVVGLHPAASRIARRAPFPVMVFNFHDQFESLRTTGKYRGLQKVTRDRDIALQGSINPVLADFGDRSEAFQYSGVPTPADWQCPFRAGARSDD